MGETERLLNKYGKASISPDEAALELGVDVADAQEVIASGELVSKKIGSKVIIPVAALANYVDGLFPDYTGNFANSTLTSTETLELVEDDVDMSKGCVIFICLTSLF